MHFKIKLWKIKWRYIKWNNQGGLLYKKNELWQIIDVFQNVYTHKMACGINENVV